MRLIWRGAAAPRTGAGRWARFGGVVLAGMLVSAPVVVGTLVISSGTADATLTNVCTWNPTEELSGTYDMSDNANWTATDGSCGSGSGQGTAALSGAELVFDIGTDSSVIPFVDQDLTADDLVFSGSTAAATPYEISGGDTLTLNPTSNSDIGVSDTASSGVTVDAPLVLGESETFSNTSSGGDILTIGDVVSDGGNGYALSLSGSGGFSLDGDNTYSGGTTIDSGVPVMMEGASALGSGTISDSGQLDVLDTGSAMTVTNILDLDSGGLLEDVTSDTWSGAISLGSGTEFITPEATFTVSGVISGGGADANLELSGPGTVDLTAQNSYLGATQLEGPTLENGIADALPDTTTLSIDSDDTYNLEGYSQLLEGISGGPGTITSTGSPTLDVSLAGNLTTTFSGDIGGTLALDVGSAGTYGTLQLSGTDTYSGSTTVSGGTLQDGATNALPTGTSLDVASGATYDLDGYDQQVAYAANDTGTITNSSNSAAGALTIGPLASNDTIGEALTAFGGQDLDLDLDAGSYTATLSGTKDSFSGTVTAATGTLDVSGSLPVPVDIDSGATLAGAGSTSGVVAGNGATVLPGTSATSPSTLTSYGSVNLAGSTLHVALTGTSEGDFSVLDVESGTVNITGATLDVTCSSFTPTTSGSFDILENQPGSAITGTFSGLAEGATLSACGQSFQITYVGGIGHDVVLTDVAAPDAPTGVSAEAGDASATVAFSAPSDNGSPVTSYEVTATDATNSANGGQTASGSSSPISVTGLTNGDSYTFTVTATNAAGTSTPSATSNTVVPAAVPDAPTGVTATAGNAQAAVSWTAPADNGATITGYTVDASGSGGQSCTTTGATSCTVSGLVNGTSYTFTVTATNGNGPGPAGASNAVTPSTSPDAPTGVTATAGNAQAAVSWTAPADNGATITGYTVDASGSGGQSCTTTGATSCTVSGLVNGTSYTFTVTATNGNGPGPAGTSNAVTPEAPTAPASPTGVTATAGNAQAAVSWTAPADNGATITGYTVDASGSGGQSCTTTGATSCTVSGLVNGTSYTFTVTATNAAGTSTASSSSSAVTPLAPVAPLPIGVSSASLGTPTSAFVSSTSATTVTETESGASATISVPAGALPSDTTVSVYPVTNTASLASSVPTGQSYVVSFAVSWQTPSGATPSASAPITMTIADPSILAGDTVYEVASTGLHAVGTATQDGSATITFTSDPTFLVAATPELSSITRRSTVQAKDVSLRFTCSEATTCAGIARLSVARRSTRHGKTVERQLVVASGSFSVGKGGTTKVLLRISAAGRRVLARRTAHRRFFVGLVTLLTGGPRSVLRVLVG